MKRSCLTIALLLAIATLANAQVLTNGGFESCPSGETDWTGAGWQSWNTFNHVSWAAHTGNMGAYLPGWGAGDGGLWEDTTAVGTGTYTLAMWVMMEAGFNTTNFEFKIEWKASDHSTAVQDTTITNLAYLPRDGLWHHVYVSGVATAAALAYVRPVLYCAWALPTNSGNSACKMDDVQLVQGSYTGIPPIGIDSIELGQTNSWAGSHWTALSENHWTPRDWAARSGSRGVALEGWSWNTEQVVTNEGVVTTNIIVNSPTNIMNQMVQSMTMVGTGTYSLSAWISREPQMVMSNAELRIEYYDQTCMNKVQNDTVTNFTVPTDNWWREYYVVGTCTSPSVYEVRSVIQMRWDRVTNSGDKAARIDDVRFRRGMHDGYSVETNWGYHSAVGGHANREAVPGTNVGTFLQVNYNAHTNTFYVLAATNLAKYMEDGDRSSAVMLRTAYQKPEDGYWNERTTPMTRVGSVTLSDAAPFHGQPVSGSQVVDLWALSLPQPTNISGAFYSTNSIRVYYSPFFKSTNGVVATDVKYLALLNGETTNHLGQSFAAEYFDRDYFYDNFKPQTWVTFTNGGFEEPTPFAANLDGTGWSGSGDVGRETWAARTGAAGAALRSYNAGTHALYQDIATTGGTYQFTGWMLMETGALPTRLEMKMEWYDKSGALVQENTQDLLSGLLKGDWRHIGVVGSCTASNLDYVRLLLTGDFSPIVGGNAATKFDDMEFGGVATNLQNVSFETGFGSDMRDWYMMPRWLGGIENWIPVHSGTNVFGFHAWETSQPSFEGALSQPVAASNGTYIFSIWIRRESNIVLTNAELRIEWYGGDYPNKVQADTVETISPVNDNAWALFSITGICDSASLRFVQPTVFAQWDMKTNELNNGFALDDAELVHFTGETYTDGIPDSWWAKYGLSLTNTAANDNDGDNFSNLEEYAGDTDPTNSASQFSNVTNASGSKMVMYLIVNPSSSARVYDAYWKTNLMDYVTPWQNYGLSVTGNGASIMLTVTNKLGNQYFRTGARLPLP